MKKWILIAAWLMAHLSWAGPVDVETARAIATQFLNGHAAKSRAGKAISTQQMTLAKTMKSASSQQALLYVFNNEGEDGGYVVAAADEVASPVLAFSEEGTFDWDNMSCCQRYLMECYAHEIEHASSQPERAAAAIKARKAVETDAATGPRKAYAAVKPLLKSKWDQGTPYNTLCPIDPNTKKRCITGCVATAAAQIMYYHKWPIQGQGSYSYEWQGKTLTANFGNTTYQWDKMKDVYKNSPTDPDNAVATLMYHCGVAANMNYGSNGSYGAISAHQFIEYFRYSPRAKFIQRSDCGKEEFERLMHKELEVGRPILFRGADENDEGGHVFVCDGCTTGNYFHFNLGWSGEKDGYYKISALDTEWYELSYFQDMSYGLQPPGETLRTANGNEYEVIGDGEVAIKKMKQTVSKFTLPTSVTIEGTTYAVTEVGSNAFDGNLTMTELTIPAGITSLNDMAFNNCPNLEKVVLDDSDIPILMGNDVFYNCNLTTLHVGRDITTNWSSFTYKYALTDITIGQQVTRLPKGAFAGCSITSITLPPNLKMIGEYAFENATQLQEINISAGNEHFIMKGKALINTDSQTLIYVLETKDNSYTIPYGVENIQGSCMWPTGIKELHIPSTVTSIGNYFIYGPNLEKVYLYTSTPATCTAYAWEGILNNNEVLPTVYVPRGSLATYKRAAVWNQLPLSEWDIPTEVEGITTNWKNEPQTTFYGVDGTRITSPRRGVNILRKSDGTTTKKFFK